MKCPTCGVELPPKSWVCDICFSVIDPAVLGLTGETREGHSVPATNSEKPEVAAAAKKNSSRSNHLSPPNGVANRFIDNEYPRHNSNHSYSSPNSRPNSPLLVDSVPLTDDALKSGSSGTPPELQSLVRVAIAEMGDSGSDPSDPPTVDDKNYLGSAIDEDFDDTNETIDAFPNDVADLFSKSSSVVVRPGPLTRGQPIPQVTQNPLNSNTEAAQRRLVNDSTPRSVSDSSNRNDTDEPLTSETEIRDMITTPPPVPQVSSSQSICEEPPQRNLNSPKHRIHSRMRPVRKKLTRKSSNPSFAPYPQNRRSSTPVSAAHVKNRQSPPHTPRRTSSNPSFASYPPQSQFSRSPDKAIAKPTSINADTTPVRIEAAKAAKFYQQALKDQMEGRLEAARTNLRLALTFDPKNTAYVEAYHAITKFQGPTNPRPSSPKSTTQFASSSLSNPGSPSEEARVLYGKAIASHELGQFDQAISFLEKALSFSRQPALLNRLAVIYASHLNSYQEAKKLLEEAISLAPGKNVYVRNLQRVIAMEASETLESVEPNQRVNFWSLLGINN